MIDIRKIQEEAETFYRTLNNVVTEGRLPLIDMTYPNHDGEQDPYAAADLMALRDRINGIKRLCENFIDNLTSAID